MIQQHIFGYGYAKVSEQKQKEDLSISNDNLDINTWFNVNVGDLTNNFRWWVQIQDSLVDFQLEAIKRVGTFTARGFAYSKTKNLGGHTHRTRYLDLHVLCLVFQLSTYFLKSFNLGTRQSNSDLVDRTGLGRGFSAILNNTNTRKN